MGRVVGWSYFNQFNLISQKRDAIGWLWVGPGFKSHRSRSSVFSEIVSEINLHALSKTIKESVDILAILYLKFACEK